MGLEGVGLGGGGGGNRCVRCELWDLLQIFVQASTTNEKMNAFRYEHFRKLQGSSPFK